MRQRLNKMEPNYVIIGFVCLIFALINAMYYLTNNRSHWGNAFGCGFLCAISLISFLKYIEQ